MTQHVDLYDGHYGQPGADPQTEVRKEAYGEDLGQAVDPSDPIGTRFLADPYLRPIDPRLRFRCNRLVNGRSTRGGQRNRRSSREYTITAMRGGAPDFSVFGGHEVRRYLRNGGVLWPLKHQQNILDDVNAHAGKERTYDNKQA